ncbi:MAG: hypothetical protein FJX72_10820 [Armatimonadetes bacterium]|nr:hypothetical protein [Armatimonadota bacterium]
MIGGFYVPDGVRIAIVVVGIILTVLCIRLVVGSGRRLNRRIAELDAEQEARQGAPMDPFAALAEIYAEEAARDAARRRGKRKHT